MDALIRALEQRGAKFIKIEKSELPEIRIDGERIECLLIEETKRSKRPQDESDQPRHFDDWQWNPTGRFRFEIQEYTDSAIQKKWTDSNREKLEGQLERIVEGLFVCAKDLKLLAIKRAEQHRRWEEERQRREEIAKNEMLELKRRKNLEEQAQQWVQSINLSAFIDACEKRMLLAHAGNLAADSQEAKWLAWAREHARRINPLTNGSPSFQ